MIDRLHGELFFEASTMEYIRVEEEGGSSHCIAEIVVSINITRSLYLISRIFAFSSFQSC